MNGNLKYTILSILHYVSMFRIGNSNEQAANWCSRVIANQAFGWRKEKRKAGLSIWKVSSDYLRAVDTTSMAHHPVVRRAKSVRHVSLQGIFIWHPPGDERRYSAIP